MAGDKYLALVNGRKSEKQAVQASTGASDAGKIPALGGDGRFDNSMMPVGIGADTKTLAASEALSAGNFVNLWNDSGTLKVRKADATAAGKEADGFVLEAAIQGDPVPVYFEGTNTQLAGLTPGARYYLSAASPGGVTDTPPTGTGKVVQFVGRAISDTEISFEADDGVILA
jgi:hypothetical protein